MFLNCLNEDEIAVIETIGEIKTYPKDAYLMQEGEPGSTFILILSGKVEVRKSLNGAKYRKLVELGACDLIGEIAFLGVHNRTASVVAVEDTEVMEFERDAFMRLIEQHPVIGMKAYRGIAEELAQRLSQSGEDLVDAITWALAQRHWLNDKEPGVVVPRAPRLAHRKTV